MVLHTFGDSHCQWGWNCIPNVISHHFGPKLCFSIGRDGIYIQTGYNVSNGDTVIFSFGEVDCRCHIHKHITTDNDYTKIIDAIVTNYFVQIKKAVDVFDTLTTAIYNIVPPIQKYNTPEDPDYPFLGTDEERKEYVLYFNYKLKQMCAEYNFIFIDVYNDYSDNNGFLNKSLSDGKVHIGDAQYLRLFVENNLL